ncbi:hypothetical protein PVK06_019691 [Gossypium arboreum]|uniref:Uncharacterized protein n=1 Tax=Gossypium arboreum TaxID=29729 RepID=A0ABR0PKX7_GOSAR|nr:hypothetical protein PVK06_019691 [Gossypium arboreum]
MSKERSFSLPQSSNGDGGDSHSVEDRTTKKPWTKNFSPLQLYPSVVLAWIRLLRLLGFLFYQQIVEAIREHIGKVVKLDF